MAPRDMSLFHFSSKHCSLAVSMAPRFRYVFGVTPGDSISSRHAVAPIASLKIWSLMCTTGGGACLQLFWQKQSNKIDRQFLSLSKALAGRI